MVNWEGAESTHTMMKYPKVWCCILQFMFLVRQCTEYIVDILFLAEMVFLFIILLSPIIPYYISSPIQYTLFFAFLNVTAARPSIVLHYLTCFSKTCIFHPMWCSYLTQLFQVYLLTNIYNFVHFTISNVIRLFEKCLGLVIAELQSMILANSTNKCAVGRCVIFVLKPYFPGRIN